MKLSTFFILITFSLVKSEIPRNSNRLSGVVTPQDYELEIRLEEDFEKTNTYSGSVKIKVTTNQTIGPNDRTFQFHAKDLKLNIQTLLDSDGKNIEATFSGSDLDTDLVTVTPKNELSAGNYVLQISFEGNLGQNSMVGLYKSTYTDIFKVQQTVLATQFEETHARKAFPCFDEPSFKTTWKMTMTYPVGYTAWSNRLRRNPSKIEGTKLETTTFMTDILGDKKKYATYQTAFVLSKFICKNADAVGKYTNIEVCSRIIPTDQSAKLALDTAPLILDQMNKNTDLTYNDIYGNLLTLAAIPDFAAGAMENPGLITFRESFLLYDEKESTHYDKQKVVTVLAHEISHLWFGDFVTLKWWNEVFLNEGFATYWEYHLAAQINIATNWGLKEQFVIEQVHSALSQDSFDSVPLSYDITDPDYGNRVNDVSYNKGGSILRMLENIFGSDNFASALKSYIKNHNYGTVTSDDLWAEFDNFDSSLPDIKIKDIMQNWITKAHYPVVTVNSKGKNIEISQVPFSLTEKIDTKWYIPLTFATSVDPDFTKTNPPQQWLTPDDSTKSIVIGDLDWVVLNKLQTGFYRVLYDDTLLEKISKVLDSKIDTIHEINRAQLVDDYMNFALANKITYTQLFKFLDFLKKETSYYTWYAAFNNFDYILHKLSEKNREALKGYIKNLMKNFYDSIMAKPEDDHVYYLKKALAVKWACKVELEDCVKDSVQAFQTFKQNSTAKPEVEVRNAVYCSGISESKDVVDDVNFVTNIYRASTVSSEKVAILKILSCTENKMILNNLLSFGIEGTDVRAQDTKYLYTAIISNSDVGITLTLDFIKERYSDIIAFFQGNSELNSLINEIASRITSKDQLDKLQKLSTIEALRVAATNAIDIANSNMDIAVNIEKSLTSYFNSHDNNNNNGFASCANLLIICILYCIHSFL